MENSSETYMSCIHRITFNTVMHLVPSDRLILKPSSRFLLKYLFPQTWSFDSSKLEFILVDSVLQQ